jgi:hypothetical protein
MPNGFFTGISMLQTLGTLLQMAQEKKGGEIFFRGNETETTHRS